MTTPNPAVPRRQPAYDAVYAVLHRHPATGLAGAMENARLWRAVEAALDAMQPAAHHLPLLDLTADEVMALTAAAQAMHTLDPLEPAYGRDPLRSALDKLTTSTEEPS